MRDFAALFNDLDTRTSTNAKVEALVRYYARAEPNDAAWATYFLAGGKPRAVVNGRALREFAVVACGVPAWLFEESYQAVGDLAETIAHLLPPPRRRNDLGLAAWVEQRLLPLRDMAPTEVLARLSEYVDELDAGERFLLIKLIGGGFRVGVSRLLVTRALAQHAGLDAKAIAQRLVGYTDIAQLPTAERFAALIDSAQAAPAGGTPYPFFLAHQLQAPLAQFDAALGPPADWLVEWKYDGIRAQLVRRCGCTWLWSRGEDLITERFPEVVQAAQELPDGLVLDGELLVWDAGSAHPAPFAHLQTRVTRKSVTSKLLQTTPAVFVAYDLLEQRGEDLRGLPQGERRARLEALLPAAGAEHGSAGTAHRSPALRLSALVLADAWPDYGWLREASRALQVEGFMLKRRDAGYGVGRTRDVGLWWKWKIDPMRADAVLVYAQRGHGRRASLYSDYTFAVWDRAPADAAEAQRYVDGIAAGRSPQALQQAGLPVLVPFAKAYSGLTDEEIRRVDAAIRKTTLEEFGPVRTVVPSLMFELGFEGIQRSARHKSGVAVRFPRMLRPRHDKPLREANTLADLAALLACSS
ncbi:MAG: cisplatin damage response ATP-dependent DNA ligase [Burkholderiales bacterium]|nr:cisplatin damage response ATP-dependent DNA ligase [Burkholderiales bacterium]